MSELKRMKEISYYSRWGCFCLFMRFLSSKKICYKVNKLSEEELLTLLEIDTHTQIIDRYGGARAGKVIQYYAAKRLKLLITLRQVREQREVKDAYTTWFQ